MTDSDQNGRVPESVLEAEPKDIAEFLATHRAADAAEALNSLDRSVAARVLEAMPVPTAIQILNEPHLDQAAELIGLCRSIARRPSSSASIRTGAPISFASCRRAIRQPLKARLPQSIRETLDQLLSYPPQSAGGLMTTDFVSVPADWTVERTLNHIHAAGRSKEVVYTVCVLRSGHEAPPQSHCALAPGHQRRQGHSPRRGAALQTDHRLAADGPRGGGQASVQVQSPGRAGGGEDGHVLGIVTVDDVIDAIIAEGDGGRAEVRRPGGARRAVSARSNFLTMIRKRAGWLCALFLSEMLTASAMQYYQVEIEKAIVLTLFIPLIMSSGGNSGSQATSLIIRALALREITLQDWWRIASRELPAGLTLGAILGVIGVTRIVLWQRLGLYDYGTYWLLVALTVGLALTAIVTFGSMVGSMLPFLLKRLGFDPATASAPFVATLVDVTGSVIYFSVAYMMLRGTLL